MGSIDLQQEAGGTDMQRRSVHQHIPAGGPDTEEEEMIVDAGQQRGRIDMQPMSSGTRAETQPDEQTKNLALGTQRGSTGQ